MRIEILCEGKTEKAFKEHLDKFLRTRLGEKVPALHFMSFDGRIPKRKKLRRIVRLLLDDRKRPADAVIALTDVYTGTNPPEFADADDAKRKLREWVGDEPRFHPHVALYDFEAWLLPYWDEIQKLAGSNRRRPGKHPERVDHGKPPAHHLREVFRTGSKSKSYIKTRDSGRILRRKDLLVAADACPELKAFLNTILRLYDASKTIP